MKKILLFILICIPLQSVFPQTQETEEEKKHPIVGMWQMCRVLQNPNDPSDQKIFRTPSFKLLNEDNSFMNFMISTTPERQFSFITVIGEYEINSDDTYTEIVEKSYTNPNDDMRKVKIGYRLDNDNKYLILTLFSLHPETGVPVQGSEFWVRVEHGSPFVKKESSSQ